MKKLISFMLILSLIACMVPAASAVRDEATEAAETLYELGLFKGTGTNPDCTPIFDLDKTPTRNQAIIMLVRLLGKEDEAKAGQWDIPFTDVSDAMWPYIGYAYANGLTNGYTATTYNGSAPTKANQYITFVLRALGYESGKDFEVAAAGKFSDEIGLTDGTYSATAKFTRGDVAQISRNALDISMEKGGLTLAEKLIREGIFSAAQYELVKKADTESPWDKIAAPFSGAGTKENPYQIETPQQLAYLAQRVNKSNTYEGRYFLLKNDIDLRNLEWTPIGDFGHMFGGKFDGGGHTISNLRITKVNPVYIGDWNHWHDTYSTLGVFGTTSTTSEIKNLSVNGEIRICERNALPKSSISAGGIVGCLYGTVANCYNDCAIRVDSDSKEAYLQAGGIAGIYGMQGFLDGCGNVGEISAAGAHVVRLGGIAGDNDGRGTMINCWNIGAVTAEGTGMEIGAGGMTCHTYNAKIQNCYNLGSVSAKDYAGGILAWQIGSDDMEGISELTNCYSAGEVRSKSGRAGAICGRLYKGTVQNVYWFQSQLRAVGSQAETAVLNAAEAVTDPQILLERLNTWVLEMQGREFKYSAWELEDGGMCPVLCK